MAERSKIRPTVLTLAQVIDCGEYVKMLKKEREILDRIREQRPKVVIQVILKIPGEDRHGRRGDIEEHHEFKTYDETSPETAALLGFMEAHYKAMIEDCENTIREFGVNPDKEE